MVQPKSRTSTRRIIESALVTLTLATLVGCTTPLTQVKQFGSTSKALGEHARSALDLAATASVDRRLYDLAADPTSGPTDETFEGLLTGDVGVSGGKEKAERLALRLLVLDQLSNYSSALQQLAEADFDRDIDEAANDLYGALIGLRGTFKEASGRDLPLTDHDFAIIGTSVNAIGKAVAEAKRRSAIKTTITKADDAVRMATQLIASDLGQNSELASFVKEAMSNSRGSVQQAYNHERVRPHSTFDSRYALLVRARELYGAEVSTPAFFEAVSRGAAAVGEAHSALRKALEADDFSSAEVAKRLGELEVYVKSVRGFYNSIRKTAN
jgi:hypothetical protein